MHEERAQLRAFILTQLKPALSQHIQHFLFVDLGLGTGSLLANALFEFFLIVDVALEQFLAYAREEGVGSSYGLLGHEELHLGGCGRGVRDAAGEVEEESLGFGGAEEQVEELEEVKLALAIGV